MGLIRLIIIIALGWLIWRLVKATLANLRSGTNGPATPPQRQGEEKMVRCDQCGVHVPESEAFFHKQKTFCSQQHQQAYLEHHDD